MTVLTQRMRRRVDESREIARAVEESLGKSPYRALHAVSFHWEHGVLFLRGVVPSYFHKQLAQEAVRRVDGVERIVNDIEVLAPPFRRAPRRRLVETPNTQTLEEIAR